MLAVSALAVLGTAYLFGRTWLPSEEVDAHEGFERVEIATHGRGDPWGKAVGDINGDGRIDLIVGGNASGGLVWYENPAWARHAIDDKGSFGTDIEVADINRDGRNDVVALRGKQLVWYRHGDWAMSIVAEQRFHDVEAADLNGDGRIDLVARDQSAFSGSGAKIHIFLQDEQGGWKDVAIDAPEGEGLRVADMDGDGRPDVVVNGAWFPNPGPKSLKWRAQPYAAQWRWPHTYVAVADINGDGRRDIVLSPAEHAGERYRIAWFEGPKDPARVPSWAEHVVDADVEAVHHFVGAADMDGDGAVDIVAAEMHQGEDPDEIKIYINRGHGLSWSKRAIATTGSHSMRLVDVDGDGDMDLFGANWEGERQPIELWLNPACPATLDRWRRHVVDSDRPGDAVFVMTGDLDGDGRRDIVTGAWWYRYTGAGWERHRLGAQANNAAAVFDIDGDGDGDVLATRGVEAGADPRFVWAENDGRGLFTVHDNIPDGEGDFLQGVAVGKFDNSGHWQVALSWHEAKRGIQLLSVPLRPDRERWTWRRISDASQDEQLSVADIDRDGRLDLLLGTQWLRNTWPTWALRPLTARSGNPDRNRLADINGDGRLDAVVGFEAISRPGDVLWYEQGATTAPWTEHRIATVIGPMSLDVADMDGDGDLDAIVGEHNLKDPAAARLFVFENVDGRGARWKEHLVWRGDEHHDGAQVADMDGDGDLDIVSIGWGHRTVLFYENRTGRCPAKH